MKYVVAIVLGIFITFMSSTFVLGFISKRSKEEAIQNQSSSSTPISTITSTQKTYTASEVAQHSSIQDCLLIIHGNVYDITSFLDQHPGGVDVILPYCGKDATQAFETKDRSRGTHSLKARTLLDQYKVGILQ